MEVSETVRRICMSKVYHTWIELDLAKSSLSTVFGLFGIIIVFSWILQIQRFFKSGIRKGKQKAYWKYWVHTVEWEWFLVFKVVYLYIIFYTSNYPYSNVWFCPVGTFCAKSHSILNHHSPALFYIISEKIFNHLFLWWNNK